MNKTDRTRGALQWTVLTAAGLGTGLAAGALVANVLSGFAGIVVVIALATATMGGVLGTFQAAAFRGVFVSRTRWIAATTAGVMAGLAVAIVAIQEAAILITGAPVRVAAASAMLRATVFIAVGLIAGSILGATQAMVVRAYRSMARRWTIACGAALAIAFCTAALAVEAVGMPFASAAGRVSFLILAGLLFGAFTFVPWRTASGALTAR